MKKRFLSISLGFSCLLATIGCTSYQRDFRRAVAEADGRYQGIGGPWKGEWKSEPSGHSGPLWCLVEPVGDDAEAIDFRYRAGWGRILRGNFTQRTPAVPVPERPGAYRVEGSKDLGALGGLYTIEGTVDPEEFAARYTSTKGDHGTMLLRRP